MKIIPGATHLFEEPGALEEVVNSILTELYGICLTFFSVLCRLLVWLETGLKSICRIHQLQLVEQCFCYATTPLYKAAFFFEDKLRFFMVSHSRLL
jgi:hypothetical protein